jgi:hypothetical protein
VSPLRYELGFYTPEDDILHSQHLKISNLPQRVSLRARTGAEMRDALPAKLASYKLVVLCYA